MGLSQGSEGGVCRQSRRCKFSPWVGKIPWRRKWLPTPMFLPGEFHGQRSLVGYSPRGHKRIEHNSLTKEQKHCIQQNLSNLRILRDVLILDHLVDPKGNHTKLMRGTSSFEIDTWRERHRDEGKVM